MLFRVHVLLLNDQAEDTSTRTLENIVSEGTCFAGCTVAICKRYTVLGVYIAIHGWGLNEEVGGLRTMVG